MKEILFALLQAILITVIPIITTYVCKFLFTKGSEVQNKVKDETAKQFLTEAVDAVTTAVIATNQTYVDTLKKSDKFTADNQREAFQKAYDTAKSIMSKEAKDFIELAYGSLNDWLTVNIEAQVKLAKQPE